MNERLPALVFWLILLFPIGVFVRQILQVRRGATPKRKGTVLFFLYSVLPILICAVAFFALVGVEELTKLSLIAEEFARLFSFVIAIGLTEVMLLTIVFALVVWLLRIPEDPT